MYTDLLEQLREKQEHSGEPLRPPCSPAALLALQERVRTELGVELPEPYAAFLQLTNGLDWNGVSLYASERTKGMTGSGRVGTFEGLVEDNLDRRDVEEFEHLLVLGDSGMDLYVYNLKRRVYEVLDSVSLDDFERFDTFDELMRHVLTRCLS
ncbi:YrhA family protein [Haliangium sp.]|uniref:YrhA family protein n=1 Tax=Haliangium sp. TaxID=2663208 RepID=UPI003D0C1BE8